MKMKTLTAIVSRNLTSMWIFIKDEWRLVVILYYINGIHIKCTEVTEFVTRILHRKIFLKIYVYLKKRVSVPTCNLPMQDINQTLRT
jgi:hypothetical protein